MAEFPSMPLFSDAYIADTAHLTLEEHGAYLLLLMNMWRNRAVIPDDDRDNARRLGLTVRKWKAIKTRLAPMLEFYGTGKDAKISQKRLQKEWNKVAEFRNKQSEKGARSAESRRQRKQEVSEYRGLAGVATTVTDGLQPEGQPKANRNSAPISNKSNITTSSIPEPRENSEEKKERGSAPSSPGAALPDGAHPSPSTSEAKGDRRNVHSLLDTPAMRRADAKLGRIS